MGFGEVSVGICMERRFAWSAAIKCLYRSQSFTISLISSLRSKVGCEDWISSTAELRPECTWLIFKKRECTYIPHSSPNFDSTNLICSRCYMNALWPFHHPRHFCAVPRLVVTSRSTNCSHLRHVRLNEDCWEGLVCMSTPLLPFNLFRGHGIREAMISKKHLMP